MSSFKKQIRQVNSLSDICSLVSWNHLQIAAAIPFIVFAVSPLTFLLHNTIKSWNLETTIENINFIISRYSMILFLLCGLKAATEHKDIKTIVKSNPVLIFFTVFCILMGISTLVNILRPDADETAVKYGLHGSTWRCESVWSYLTYIISYFGCSLMVANHPIRIKLIRLLQIVSIIQVILVFLDRHFSEIEPFHREQYPNNITSVFSNRNFYSYYLTIILLLSAVLFILEKNKKWRIFDCICYILNTFTLMRADTLGCFIAGATGILFLVLFLHITKNAEKKSIIIIIISYFALFMINAIINSDLINSFLALFGDISKVINKDDNAGSAGTGRWKLWVHTVKYIGERPLLGWGAEGIFDRLESEAGNSRTHNEYLQYTAFFGIPAGLCYIAGLFSILLKSFKNRFKLDMYNIAALTAAIGYAVSACFGNTVFSVAPYFFCTLGLACGITGNNSKETPSVTSGAKEEIWLIL